MLASTVKFSRCGRLRGATRRAPVSRPLEGQLRMRPNPQDSTACLGYCALQVGVPLLQAGSTDDEFDEEAYWSMFHIPVPARLQSKAEEPSKWTDPSDLPNGSLERR